MSSLKCCPTEAMAKGYRKVANNPYKTAAVVVVAAGAIGLVMMWPEIQRYIKMKRM